MADPFGIDLIFNKICHYIPGKREILKCRLVCKSWNIRICNQLIPKYNLTLTPENVNEYWNLIFNNNVQQSQQCSKPEEESGSGTGSIGFFNIKVQIPENVNSSITTKFIKQVLEVQGLLNDDHTNANKQIIIDSIICNAKLEDLDWPTFKQLVRTSADKLRALHINGYVLTNLPLLNLTYPLLTTIDFNCSQITNEYVNSILTLLNSTKVLRNLQITVLNSGPVKDFNFNHHQQHLQHKAELDHLQQLEIPEVLLPIFTQLHCNNLTHLKIHFGKDYNAKLTKHNLNNFLVQNSCYLRLRSFELYFHHERFSNEFPILWQSFNSLEHFGYYIKYPATEFNSPAFINADNMRPELFPKLKSVSTSLGTVIYKSIEVEVVNGIHDRARNDNFLNPFQFYNIIFPNVRTINYYILDSNDVDFGFTWGTGVSLEEHTGYLSTMYPNANRLKVNGSLELRECGPAQVMSPKDDLSNLKENLVHQKVVLKAIIKVAPLQLEVLELSCCHFKLLSEVQEEKSEFYIKLQGLKILKVSTCEFTCQNSEQQCVDSKEFQDVLVMFQKKFNTLTLEIP